MRSKYGNRKTIMFGIEFDSKREAERYMELIAMQQRGEITGLECQKTYVLADSVIVQGRKRPPLRYVADFVYVRDGQTITEDVKGMLTDVYKIKRHLMRSVHGIEISEVK